MKDDTISRQKIKDMIKNHKSDFSTEKDYWTARACVDAVPPTQSEILSTPSYSISIGEPVEYIPIMRCKDCKYYLPPHGCAHIDGMATAQENGFCSYAERKTI